MRKRYIVIGTILAAFVLQSSSVYISSHTSRLFNAIKESTDPPMSLYGYHAINVWEEAKAVEFQYNIPTDLLKALILWESDGKINAYNKNKNKSVDRGPVQLNSACLPHFSARYNGGNPIDPVSLDSIRIAGKLLADHYRRYHSWHEAVQRYNYRAKGYADFVFKRYLMLKGLD